MQDETNHYDYLGVSPASPDELIEAGVWRLVDRAIALSHTSPQRSDELWERIRAIRQDLLSGAEARRAYNATLLAAEDASRKVADASGDAAEVRPATVRVIPKRGKLSRSNLLREYSLDGLIGVAVMVAVALLIVRPWASKSHSAGVALALSTNGIQQGSGYQSGQRVELRWSPIPNAVVYRLQAATSRIIELPAIPLSQPSLSVLTQAHTFRMNVIGRQFYYWRVRANVGGAWQPYAPARVFVVSAPSIATPTPITPRSHSIVHPGGTRFCWTSVNRAAGYALFVRGSRSIVRTTCTTSDLKRPGGYMWQVAALVRGVHLYQGKLSQRASFTVRVPQAHLARKPASSGSTVTSPQTSNQVVVSSPSVIPAVATAPVARSQTKRPALAAHATARIPLPPPPPALPLNPRRLHKALVGGSTTTSIPPPPAPPPVPRH